MTLKEQVYAQAALLAGQLETQQADMLNVLCTAATASLTARLKEGLRPEDCTGSLSDWKKQRFSANLI